MEYDLVVIGGGAAGLSAARTAVGGGARALLVSEGPLGGDCTWVGCVPSKTLIAAAARSASFEEAMAAVHRAVAEIALTEDEGVLRREGVDVLRGRAAFTAPGHLEVDGRGITGRRFVIATGTEPFVPLVEGLDDVEVLTNENVFDLDDRPGTLAVLGGGAVGCELAQAFRRLGSRVVVLEMLDRLVAKEEPEASEVVAQAFAEEGIELRLGRKVVKAQALSARGSARLHLEDGEALDADRVLVAVGRSPVTAGLGLEAAGVATGQSGYVETDDRLATTAPGVYAAGDITGKLPFTHAADEMGRIAAWNALGRVAWRRFRAGAVPWVTFTDPEVARVGMTEAEAAEAVPGARVAYLPMSELDRAVVTGQSLGFVKLVAGPRPVLGSLGGGRLLGATAVAARGGEMIHEVALAIRTRMFTGRLAQTVHAYPTWSLAVRQAAAQFFVESGGRVARPARR